MIEECNSFLVEYQNTILAWGFVILSVLIWAIYSSKSTWRQKKYFKLQQISEDILINLWKYDASRQEFYDRQVSIDYELDQSEGHYEASDSQQKELWYIYEKEQKHHDLIFSKIQIYFSEFWLTDVRDISVELSHLIAEEYLLKDRESQEFRDKQHEITNKINELRDVLIIRVKRYWRPWHKNFIYYWIEKYNSIKKDQN